MSVRVFLLGGLGNQMFQYAAGRALALQLREDLVLDRTTYDFPPATGVPRPFELDSLSLPPEVSLGKMGRNFARVLSRAEALFPPRLLRLLGVYREEAPFRFAPLPRGAGPKLLLGFFQDPAYFAGLEDRLRAELGTLRGPGGEVAELRERIRGCPHPVCVHVRRGDYVTHPGAAAFHQVTPLDYYVRAMGSLRARLGGQAAFFVFSDDLAWCREAMGGEQGVVFAEGSPSSGAATLVAMASCRHFVIANSSFSWWAQWLGARRDSVVMAPRRWTSVHETAQLGLGACATDIW